MSGWCSDGDEHFGNRDSGMKCLVQFNAKSTGLAMCHRRVYS